MSRQFFFNKIIKIIITIILILPQTISPCYALTAQSILNDAASQIKTNKGIYATYTFISRQTGKQTGSIKISGNKFCIINPVVSTWYNGQYLWNVNHGSGEVTLSVPHKEELQMVNPYMLITSYASTYTPKLITSKIKNTNCILLTSKSKTNAIRKIIIYLHKSDNRPLRVDITDDSNQTSTIVITNYKVVNKFSPSEFVFPTKKFPKVKIIDLR